MVTDSSPPYTHSLREFCFATKRAKAHNFTDRSDYQHFLLVKYLYISRYLSFHFMGFSSYPRARNLHFRKKKTSNFPIRILEVSTEGVCLSIIHSPIYKTSYTKKHGENSKKKNTERAVVRCILKKENSKNTQESLTLICPQNKTKLFLMS